MKNRDEWLAKTIEEVIEPDLPICDPHHHVWEYPGSRYLLDELLMDLEGGHRIVSTVFVECLQKYRDGGPEILRPVGETEFVDKLASDNDSPIQVAKGIVAFADLTLGSAIEAVIEAQLETSNRVRGFRYASAWDKSEKVNNGHTNPPEALLKEAKFREGLACVYKHGLVFDAWLYFHQIPELVELAQTFPDLCIVLNHIGGPLGIGPYADKRKEVFDSWRANIAELARCENVMIKMAA